MVELVEVEDESFENKQVGASDHEDDDEYTDTGTPSSPNVVLPSLTLARFGDIHG